MKIVIEELETPGERYVRIRDDCLDIIRFSPDPDEKQAAKLRLKEAFEEWWNTL